MTRFDRYEFRQALPYSFGSKYTKSEHRMAKEIAKDIRADIKEAVKKSLLPEGKYSVVCKHYSGGRSINVTVREISTPILNLEWVMWMQLEESSDEMPERYTENAQKVIATLEAIVGQYNYDNSDPMTDYFDVNFYSSCIFDWQYAEKIFQRLFAIADGKEAP